MTLVQVWMEILSLDSKNLEHKPDIVSLLKPRVSWAKLDVIIAKLGFQFSHCVEAIGYFGGIWLGWKDSIRLEVVRSHPLFILTQDNSKIHEGGASWACIFGLLIWNLWKNCNLFIFRGRS
ncbi:hypothetical protein V6Z11_A10G209100 [Gossypium hirsutum]